MSRHLVRPLKITAAWGGILLAGAVAGCFGREARRHERLAEFQDDAKRSAVVPGGAGG